MPIKSAQMVNMNNNINNEINGAFPTNSPLTNNNGMCSTCSDSKNIYSNILNLNNLKSVVDLYTNLNKVVNDIVGIKVKWFRAIPVKEQQDVLFMTYTLSNVEECPLEINAVLPSGTYNDSQYTYDMMGLEYEVPLELQIDKNTWAQAAGPETMPQRGDIVYIPISNKLYEVVSSTVIRGFMEQETGYRVNLTKYKPTVSRKEGQLLKDTIDNYTVSVEELFGKQIDDTINNLVDDKQTSPYNSTSEDKYKKISRYVNIISNTIEIKGHKTIKSYYDLSNFNKNNIAIEYLNINDTILKDDFRYYNCWFNIKSNNLNEGYIDEINEYNKDSKYTYFKLKYGGNKLNFKINDNIVIYRGNIILYGKILSIDNGLNVCINNLSLFKLRKSVKDWTLINGFKIKKDYKLNLLSGYSNDNKLLSIDIYANKFIELNYNNQLYVIELTNSLNLNTWYNIAINIGNIFNVKLFTYDSDLIKLFDNEIILSTNDITIESYLIENSNSYITNIRLYNTYCYDEQSIENDAISYFVQNAANGIILDNANIEFNSEYFGLQK